MSEVTDWEPEMKPETKWQEQYEHQLKTNAVLASENLELRSQLESLQDRIAELEETCKTHVMQFEMCRQQLITVGEDYHHALATLRETANSLRVTQTDYSNYKTSSRQKFSCLKAEIVTSLRAINLCLLASINTEKQQLTHRARNFRMKHVNQIISNEIDRFCDRKLTSYEDDF